MLHVAKCVVRFVVLVLLLGIYVINFDSLLWFGLCI